MKKHLWLVLLVAGLLLIAAVAVSIAVPFLHALITPSESIAIIGGADGPTALYVTQQRSWGLLLGRAGLSLVGVFLVIAGITLKIVQKKK